VQQATQSLQYRPSIDGLRSIAVLSVVLFHLNPSVLRGGFVGVDIFFVISGYLITIILIRDCSRQRLSLPRFYQRRIARLFPSLFLVGIVTLVAAGFMFLPADFSDTGRHLVHAVLSYANVRDMAEQGGYFGITKDSHPLLHCWSLSVEEQFYLFFPTVLFLLYRFIPKRVTALLVIFAGISFGLCILVTRTNPAWAFYMLPTRAWELLSGGILANIGDRVGILNRLKSWTTWIGLTLIAGSFAFVREAGFPGYQALMPVAGSVAVLYGCVRAEGSAQKLLSWGPLVWIGQMSYTLYLWHWVVFCFVDYGCYSAPPMLRVVLKVVLTSAATIITYYMLERPARRFLNRPDNRKWAFTFAIVMLLIIVPSGTWIRRRYFVDSTVSLLAQNGLAFNSAATGPSMVLMGDSHASRLGTGLRDLAFRRNMRLNVLSMSGEDPLAGSGDPHGAWSGSFAAVQRIHPDILILEESWSVRLHSHPERLASSLNQLLPYAGKILLITQPPKLPPDGSREGIRHGARPPFRELREDRQDRESANAVVRSFAGPRILIVETDPLFLDSQGSIPFTDSAGKQLYFDYSHISQFGAARVISSLDKVVQRF